jgi:hypothetical protein
VSAQRKQAVCETTYVDMPNAFADVIRARARTHLCRIAA